MRMIEENMAKQLEWCSEAPFYTLGPLTFHPPENTRKILECLHLPTRAPPTKAAAYESLNEFC